MSSPCGNTLTNPASSPNPIPAFVTTTKTAQKNSPKPNSSTTKTTTRPSAINTLRVGNLRSCKNNASSWRGNLSGFDVAHFDSNSAASAAIRAYSSSLSFLAICCLKIFQLILGLSIYLHPIICKDSTCRAERKIKDHFLFCATVAFH